MVQWRIRFPRADYARVLDGCSNSLEELPLLNCIAATPFRVVLQSLC